MGKRDGRGERDKKRVDKKDALSKYVRSYLLKLTSTNATKALEKSLRKLFMEENYLPANSRFSAKEVAEELISYILRTRSFGWEEFSDLINKIPFITEELSLEQIRILYQSHTSGSSLVFNASDLSKLSQEEYLKRIEEEFKSKAKERAREEISIEKAEMDKLKEELYRKEEELKKFETELNNFPKDIGIEEIAKQVETDGAESNLLDLGSSWWKRLGMPLNPLDTYDGLYGIAQDKYDEVVVKTSLVNKYLGEIRDQPEAFSGKTMMVIGDYGSGKTTLFEYLSSQAISLNVVPMLIVLNPGPSVASIMNIFLQELRNQLVDTSKSVYKTEITSDRFSTNLYNDCLELFKDLSVEVPHGFLIFIDGLHKTKAYLKPVFEFLQQIQNTLTYFTRRKIKLGFIIAGSPYWKFELENNTSMSGSYYRIDEIPIPTEKEATESITKRMNLYQKELSQSITIDESSLRKSFQVLSGRLPNPVTFRDFISHVRRRLELNKFDEIGLSVKIHIETVDAVKASIRRSHLYNKYKSLLLDISESVSVRTAMQKVVAGMIKYKGISESNPIFEKNKGVFYLLKKHDLIIQHKDSGNDQFKWHLSDEMITTIIEISQRLKLEPSKIVRAMFEEETTMKEEEVNSIYSSSSSTIRGLISSWKESIPEVVDLLSNCKSTIDGINTRVAEGEYVKSSDLSYSLMQIIKAINVIMNSENVSDSDHLQDFLLSWVSPDNVDEIREFCEEKIKIPNETPKVYGLLHNHNRLISQLLDLLSEQVKGEALCRLNGRKLTINQFTSIHQLRIKFQMQAYEEVIDGSCNLIEHSIRDHVYSSMRVIWGEQAINRIPSDITDKLSKFRGRGHPRTQRSSDPNFLYDVSRSEYTKIIFRNDISKALFGNRLSNIDKDKLRDNLELAFSLGDRLAHRDRKSYFRTHATEISDVLKNLPWILEIFGNLFLYFLEKCEIELGRLSEDKLSLRFKVDFADSKIFIIQKETLDNFSKEFLETLSFRTMPIDNPDSLFLNYGLEPEASFSIFRALLANNFIEVIDSTISLGFINITNNGKELLEKYYSKPVGTKQD